MSQSTLASGDIAIIQYRTDSPDGFTFVTFVDLDADTEIHFTDKGWDGTSFGTGENTWSWTAPAGGLPKGSVVAMANLQGLSNDGDQVLAYQGTSTSPRFLYAVTSNTWQAAGNINSNSSYLPTGLSNGDTARDFSNNFDNGYYRVGRNSGTPAAIRRLIGNTSNWDRRNSSSHPFQSPSFWHFDVGEGSASSPTITVANTTTEFLSLPENDAGVVSGVIDDATDPAAQLGIDFTIANEDTPLPSLRVECSVIRESDERPCDDPSAEPTVTLTGTGGSRNLKISPRRAGYAEIRVTVSDGSLTDEYRIDYAASAAPSSLAISRFHTGASDASTAVSVDSHYMFVGNDEDQTIRLYDRDYSGLPIASFDFHDDLNVEAEVDIEASTQVQNGNRTRIYWIGSHGNDRRGNPEPDRNRLFATNILGNGASATLSYIGRYDRLRDDLRAWGDSQGYNFTESMRAGKSPIEPDGFNIEGLTVAPDNTTAYLGLRAPLVPVGNRTKALIVPITNFDALVSDTSQVSAQFGNPIELDLDSLGIRNLARNSSGQYLIVAGGPGDDNNFQLFSWTGDPADAPTRLMTEPDMIVLNGNQPDGHTGSYEAVLVPENLDLESEDMMLHLIVDNGRADWYGDGRESNSLRGNFQKFRSDTVILEPVSPSETTNIAVYHPRTGNWFIRDRDTGGILPIANNNCREGLDCSISWGFIDTLAAPGDYDGDGITDIAVYHPRTGNWFIRERDTGGILPIVNNCREGLDCSISWGFIDTLPAPGDYDGDGITDIAVYHPRTGNWFIRDRDTGGILPIVNNCRGGVNCSISWGFIDTLPAPGDYDGDGITDIAVYHPRTGNWFIRERDTGGILPIANNNCREGLDCSISWGFITTLSAPGVFESR